MCYQQIETDMIVRVWAHTSWMPIHSLLPVGAENNIFFGQ